MKEDDLNGGCLVAFLWIGTIALSIGAGIFTWKLIDPETFFGFVGFVILWAILTKVAHLIVMGIVAIFFNN